MIKQIKSHYSGNLNKNILLNVSFIGQMKKNVI